MPFGAGAYIWDNVAAIWWQGRRAWAARRWHAGV